VPAPSAWPKSRITARDWALLTSRSISIIDSASIRIWSNPSRTRARETVVTAAASRVR
jgi:hypothetical protein